jgi:hypothetical protein
MPCSGLRRRSVILYLSISLLQYFVCAGGSLDLFSIIRTTITGSSFTKRRTRKRKDFWNVLSLQAGDDGGSVPFDPTHNPLHRQLGGLRGRQQQGRSLSYFFTPNAPPADTPSLSPKNPPTLPPTAFARDEVTSNLQSFEPPIPPITSHPVGMDSSAPESLNSYEPISITTPPEVHNKTDLGSIEQDDDVEPTSEPTEVAGSENVNDDDSVLEEGLDATVLPTMEPIELAVHEQDLSRQPLPATVFPSVDQGQAVHPLSGTILSGQIPGYNSSEILANNTPPVTKYPVVAPFDAHEMPLASIMPGQILGYPEITISPLPPVAQLPVAPLDGYEMATTSATVQISIHPEIIATSLPAATQIPVVGPEDGYEKPAASIAPGQTPGYMPTTDVPGLSEQAAHVPIVKESVPGPEPGLNHEAMMTEPVVFATTLPPTKGAPTEVETTERVKGAEEEVVFATTLQPTKGAPTEAETTEQSKSAEEEPTSEESLPQEETSVHESEPSTPKSEVEHSEPLTQENESMPVAARARDSYDGKEDLEDLEKEEEELEEELAQEEREVRRIGGFGVFLAIIAMIFTAHQMSENPDGE